jgi:PAS domain S-box-containing protein
MVSVLSDAADVLFAVGYLVAPAAMRAGLVAAVGVEEGGALAPREIRLVPGAAWPLHEATGPVLVNDLGLRFRGHRVGTDGVTPAAAVVNPLRDDAEDRVVGHLVLGVDPYVKLDDRYREFLMLVADAVAARMAEAHARRRELHRLERLAELDRAKTEFFSNVSHEFRTPLTLMLGPLEQLLEDEGLPAERKADLQLIGRSAHRLLRLVGTMLDFSQIEAGRLRAHFAPVDLANRTREIVGQFESAAALAGLELRVDIDELPERVWVDAEMWEKIVSNLLSNALKFTFDGEIEVALRALPKHAELTVRDTGVGIAEEELPHIFERFHRVRGSRARSQEGAGIGLALVDELVRRHHGRIRASSRLDAGTTFTVWVPLGRRPARPEAAQEPPATTAVAAAMADEAMQWGEGREPQSFADDEHALRQSLGNYAPGARVLVADDNQDMREYLTRLLTPHWGVEAVPNGTQALEQARANRPDLVLADVMMPGLDGFALLRELREDAALRAVPVVLVTARAGEEAAIEGLLAGADDYIVKPFAARELVARVGGQLELARIRRRAAELNAFRIGLSDALRELADPLEIQRTACRMLLDQIAVDRARFVEVDEAAGEFVTLGGHAVEGMPDGYGRYPIAAYAPLARAIASGQVLAIEDSQNNDAVHDIRDALAALEIGAQLVVPLARSGRSQVALAVHHRTPRRWSPEDIAIAEEVAGRAWAEVERARAEESLRASEARFRALAETSPVGVAVTDAEKSVIVYSNRAYAAIMGRDPDELEGQPSTSVYYDPADRSWLAEMTASGAITGHEVRFKHKDGSPVWVSINVAPIDFAGRPAIIGIVQRQQDGP